MNNQKTIFTTILLMLGCVALSPVTQARQLSEDRGNGNSAAERVEALNLGTTGSNNTAHGWFSLFSNTNGLSNTADGFQALYSNTTGSANTAIGASALLSNTTGFGNTAIGGLPLFSNTEGDDNTALGNGALFSNTIGSENTAVGFQALVANTTRDSNTAVGSQALLTNTAGTNNTAVGAHALFNNVNGANNTAVGIAALAGATGSGNIGVGDGAGAGVTTANHVICIGAFGDNVSDSCYIANIAFQPSPSGVPVLINGSEKLGIVTSSLRFKDDIKAMDIASEAILSLRPVTFRYKKEIDPAGASQFGLIAEEVEKVNPDLVVRDKQGKPFSVRYDQVNAMLLNEFLKEHKKVQELKAQLAQQQKEFGSKLSQQEKQIESLSAGLQKVTAQLAMSKPAPEMAANNQ